MGEILNLAARGCLPARSAFVLVAGACDDDPTGPIDGSVKTLDVVPASAWLNPGSTLQLNGDRQGFNWSAVHQSGGVVLVRSRGLYLCRRTDRRRAVASGTAIVYAEAGGIRTAANVTVTAATSTQSRGASSARASRMPRCSAPGRIDATSLAIVAGQAGVIMESTGGQWQLRAGADRGIVHWCLGIERDERVRGRHEWRDFPPDRRRLERDAEPNEQHAARRVGKVGERGLR